MLDPKVSRSTISQWENNRTKPKRDNFFRLADVLDVTVDWLLKDEGPGPAVGREPPTLRRSLVQAVAEALEAHLQARDLILDPPDFARALLAVYDWAEDVRREDPEAELNIGSIAAFLQLASPRRRA